MAAADPDHCACGCRRKAPRGLQPRFVDGDCRDRWIGLLDITSQPTEAARVPGLLDAGPQLMPPLSAPVPVTEAAKVQAEFVERVTVAPQVEAVLRETPSGMQVRPSPRSLWKLLAGAVRRVW